jgi:hypothetical protein
MSVKRRFVVSGIFAHIAMSKAFTKESDADGR